MVADQQKKKKKVGQLFNSIHWFIQSKKVVGIPKATTASRPGVHATDSRLECPNSLTKEGLGGCPVRENY